MRHISLATASIVLALAAATPARAHQSPRQPYWAEVERETLEHFQALLRIDTRNPPGNERRDLARPWGREAARDGLEFPGVATTGRTD